MAWGGMRGFWSVLRASEFDPASGRVSPGEFLGGARAVTTGEGATGRDPDRVRHDQGRDDLGRRIVR